MALAAASQLAVISSVSIPNQLASSATSSPSPLTTRAWIAVHPTVRARYGRTAHKQKPSCWIASTVLRWTQLRWLEKSRISLNRLRKGLTYDIKSEAPSIASSGGGDEGSKIITEDLSSASTTSAGKHSQSTRASSSTSTVAPASSASSPSATRDVHFEIKTDTFLSITVIGATGELAIGKIFPALFALYYGGCLPNDFAVFGYARHSLTDEELRELISERLPCRIQDQENCGATMQKFLERVFYKSGQYHSCEDLKVLSNRMKSLEGGKIVNRLFYLSVPEEVVPVVAPCLSESAQSENGWTRVLVEKPFGKDAVSSAKLAKALLSGFKEEQIYRIDQLLGKELIENLTVLRFSNLVFEPLWSRKYIRNVQFTYFEDWGVTEGKGRYFDEYGVIRDLIQSHLLPTIALFAMEPPVSLDGDDIRNEKVKVLRSMSRPTFPDDVALGQYKASVSKDGKSRLPGFLDVPDVKPNSLTPTYAAMVLYINNARWDDVPFIIKAGIGLNKYLVEIRIRFRHVPGNIYRGLLGYNLDAATNELILRVQPDEGIFLKINNKCPGLKTQLDTTELNLLYYDKYESAVPDSYERLILDVINGNNHLFLRGDELAETWNLLSPLLEEIESQRIVPELYPFGGRGPIGAYYLNTAHKVTALDE